MTAVPALESELLPAGVRSRLVPGVNGLTMHVLESGFESPGRPCLLLLHGFPELAFSWRKLMPQLAAAGYHVVAPDQRGYGRTTGWDRRYDGDLGQFRVFNLVRDLLALVAALGHRSVQAVVGHDFGSPTAAWCALIRPDVFRSVVMMSAPFAGPPAAAVGGESGGESSGESSATPTGASTNPTTGQRRAGSAADIHQALAALDPPRKHYQWYYSTREANDDMWRCPQGVHDFLRAYYHVKSADWPGNEPFPLAGWTAPELARMPTYYVMALDKGMAETVAPAMPSAQAIADCAWLTDDELRVYSGEYRRTGFQGGLQWYRCATSARASAELQLFSGRTIDVPSLFIAGNRDWGIHQRPGALSTMQGEACTQMLGCHLVEGAGHWVQQEQPGETARLLLEFLRVSGPADRRRAATA